MEFVIKISQFLLSLSLLIVLHELGHFIPAKLFKTRVEKFYLFFDVKYSLFKKKIGDTVYGIGWLPLGGYVKISGMIDESMDTEQMKHEPQPWEFRSKPSWQRLIIMLGGVTVNFILAAVIYIFMTFSYGVIDIDASSVNGGYEIKSSLLNEIGLQNGDKVISINDYNIVNFSDIRRYLIEAKTMTIVRDGSPKTIEFPTDFLGQLSASKPKGLIELRNPFIFSGFQQGSINSSADLQSGDILVSIKNQPAQFMDEINPILKSLKGQTVSFTFKRNGDLLTQDLVVNSEGYLGILLSQSIQDFTNAGFYEIVKKEYDFGDSISVGINRFGLEMSSYWSQLKLIFSPSTGAYKGVGGFKAIFDIFPDTWNWEGFWARTALLSIMLGVLNLLPIPALDGGHVMFLVYEMISGRKPSDKFMEYAQTVGFFLLISLIIFANGNDIYKVLFG
ncbi:MAG: RIP metalloprotease RseP [Formosa sp.]|jgi:regulator of sigma E protease|nr:RIP metalloprotease RseP [Formosa sp.]MDA9639986.1 RIP metalloprotease RseP [Flavobacteriaceae bacterium]MDB2426278.1 RIP metalloprotease RseP [Flavobacteriaceae bacterium]MDC0382236.1 RIP metalloprotease RseP [Flavobacteriaceae bacterium]MDC0463948.1 RIP metalloprotease RseP [Flavobacteriaceae bacterium]|tara:strand:+ start:9448 stop:10788 length:1341 start_codon:yes stop_codon:yes gene_type:complete